MTAVAPVPEPDLTANDPVMTLGQRVVELAHAGHGGIGITAVTGATAVEALFAAGAYLGRILAGQATPPSAACRLGPDTWCSEHQVFHPITSASGTGGQETIR